MRMIWPPRTTARGVIRQAEKALPAVYRALYGERYVGMRDGKVIIASKTNIPPIKRKRGR